MQRTSHIKNAVVRVDRTRKLMKNTSMFVVVTRIQNVIWHMSLSDLH